MIQARKAMSAMLTLGFATLVVLTPVKAQQDSSNAPRKDEPPKPAASSVPGMPSETAADDANVELVPAGPPDPYGGAIKDASTGLPLFGASSTPLRWGNVSINTFEFIGIHDDFDLPGNLSTVSSDIFYFRVGLMFDRYLLRNKSRIVLQYVPQMAIVNGQFHANAALNNNVSLGTKFELTRRLSATLGNIFVQTQSNPLIPQNYLAVDGNAGSLAQNNFLNTNGSFIADTASAVFEYELSPRTNVTFSPLYRYSRATNNLPGYLAAGQTYAGVVTLGHAFSPHRTIGIVDSFQYLKESNLGIPQNATYDTIGVFYSEQLARTLWLTGNAGAVSQSYSNFSGASGWGFNGSFSIIKSVSARIGLTLAYSRGISFNNYVTLRRSDRADASASFKVSSRISWNNGFGYYRELGGGPRTSAKYAQTDLTYHIYGSLGLFTTFAYAYQSASTPQLQSGGRRTLAYGIRWAPSISLLK